MKHVEYKPFFAALLALAVISMAASVATLGVRAQNNDDGVRFFTRLSTFNAFTWEGLTGPPLVAHIHFGLKGGNYSVMTFLCGGPKGNPAIPQKPDCPQSTSGMITGTTDAGDIIALNSGTTDQALDSHDFAGFLRALRAGSAYANMHTTRFPGGEIRGQIAVNRGEPDDEN